MTEITQEEIEAITCALQYYLNDLYKEICDYETVIRNRKTTTIDVGGIPQTVYIYECPCQTIYLNSLHYPVSYGRQHIMNNDYYYDFNEYNDEIDQAGTYTRVNDCEWHKTLPEHDPI